VDNNYLDLGMNKSEFIHTLPVEAYVEASIKVFFLTRTLVKQAHKELACVNESTTKLIASTDQTEPSVEERAQTGEGGGRCQVISAHALLGARSCSAAGGGGGGAPGLSVSLKLRQGRKKKQVLAGSTAPLTLQLRFLFAAKILCRVLFRASNQRRATEASFQRRICSC
jgi:hypothetical protein